MTNTHVSKTIAVALAGGIDPCSGWDDQNHRLHQGETLLAEPDPSKGGEDSGKGPDGDTFQIAVPICCEEGG